MASAVARARHERRRDALVIGGAAVIPPAVGGAALLTGETAGFATDFTHAVDAERVAVKTAGTVVASGTSFFTSSGTSSKWVYNAAGTLVNIPVGTLPLDYDPVTHAALGLLCEPAATNLLFQSSVFTSWTALSGASVTADTTVSPTGATDADTITYTSDPAGVIYAATSALAAGTAYTVSVFAKVASGTRLFRLRIFDSTTQYYSAALTATTTWQRFSFTATAGASATGYGSIHNDAVGTAGNLIAWGAQMEPGSVASSHIPTFGVTATRAANSYSVTGASINYSATAGSWWADFTALAGQATWGVIGKGGSATPMHSSAPTSLNIYDGGYLIKTVSSALGSHKVGVAFAASDRAITADGLAVSTDAGSATNLLSLTSIDVGNFSTQQMNGYIRKLRYVPRRKTGPELVAETT